MSRLGKKPLPIPQGVKVTANGQIVEVTGPQGALKNNLPKGVSVSIDAAAQTLSCSFNEGGRTNLLGLSRTLVKNMLDGVTQGFSKSLELHGVGFRAEVVAQDMLVMQLGFSHPVRFKVPDGVKATVDKQTAITLKGVSKEQIGQVAARIRSIKPPEPYKGTGITYAGEVVSRKAGKAGAGAGAAGAGGGGGKK